MLTSDEAIDDVISGGHPGSTVTLSLTFRKHVHR